MLQVVAHLLVLLLLPPLLLGVIHRTKALFAGRRGPPLLQVYFDLRKLLRKELVLSETTSWVFLAGPLVTLAAVILAGSMVPLGGLRAPLAFAGDLFLFAYLLGTARFFTTLAALDTGSAFEGMGAAREVSFACVSEPALFLALLAWAHGSSSRSLSEMLPAAFSSGSTLAGGAMVLVALGLFVILLAETCRIPVDDPNTHLELTMIHEVMVLDHSGPLLGIILYAAALKLQVLGTLFLHTLPRIETGWMVGNLAVTLLELLLLASVIGVVESVMARLRMRLVPHLLVIALLSCGFGLLLKVRGLP